MFSGALGHEYHEVTVMMAVPPNSADFWFGQGTLMQNLLLSPGTFPLMLWLNHALSANI